MAKTKNAFTIINLAAWLVHFITASSVVFGFFALNEIVKGNYIPAFWLMGIALVIDAFDGTLARAVNVSKNAAKIDGALLDNIVDYFNYVVVPAFLLFNHPYMLHEKFKFILPTLILLTSTYQFSQRDAKTKDHFFKGFPSYWNIAVFHLFMLDLSPSTNAFVLITLAVLIFIPIKYVYPSRLDHFAKNKALKWTMIISSGLYGFACVSLLWTYPQSQIILQAITIYYISFYGIMSLYRTFNPISIK